MKKTFSSKKSAFSLIELSIVLIIIGLLIAGITGGASLIKSSELRSIMGEARGYAVAVNSFFTQYDQYPGDASTNVGLSSLTEALGDRDNKIEFVNDASSSPMAEGIDAWFDLKDIGAIDLALTPLGHTNATTGTLHAPGILVPVTDIPGSKIKGAGWAFDYNTASLQNVVVLTGTTAAYVAPPSTGAGTAANTSTLVNGLNYASGEGPLATRNASTEIISAPDSLSIDSKIDDGKADSGNVRSVNQSATTGEVCSSVASYNVTSGAKKICVLTFRVDVSS